MHNTNKLFYKAVKDTLNISNQSVCISPASVCAPRVWVPTPGTASWVGTAAGSPLQTPSSAEEKKRNDTCT